MNTREGMTVNNVTPFTARPAAPAPLPGSDGFSERELSSEEAAAAVSLTFSLTLLVLEVAKLLHRASVLQAGVDALVDWNALAPRTQQYFREQAEQAVCRLDTVKHRNALADAFDLFKNGGSFEEALGRYHGQLAAVCR
jgi:hypothetical protein